jgi:hypothetical protein
VSETHQNLDLQSLVKSFLLLLFCYQIGELLDEKKEKRELLEHWVLL